MAPCLLKPLFFTSSIRKPRIPFFLTCHFEFPTLLSRLAALRVSRSGFALVLQGPFALSQPRLHPFFQALIAGCLLLRAELRVAVYEPLTLPHVSVVTACRPSVTVMANRTSKYHLRAWDQSKKIHLRISILKLDFGIQTVNPLALLSHGIKLEIVISLFLLAASCLLVHLPPEQDSLEQ